MALGFWLYLPLTLLSLLGLVGALRAVRSAPLYGILLAHLGLSLASILLYSLQHPGYTTAKAIYGLSMILPFTLLCVLGATRLLDRLATRSRGPLAARLLDGYLASLWAVGYLTYARI